MKCFYLFKQGQYATSTTAMFGHQYFPAVPIPCRNLPLNSSTYYTSFSYSTQIIYYDFTLSFSIKISSTMLDTLNGHQYFPAVPNL